MNDTFDHLFVAPSDFEASLAFYRDQLGWGVLYQWDNASPNAASARGAMLSGGGVKIVIAQPHKAGDHAEDSAWSANINGVRPTLHLRVDDLEARFVQLAATTKVVIPPEATHWGTRWFVVADPDNNLIAFETPTQ